jgi:hypothetical protein
MERDRGIAKAVLFVEGLTGRDVDRSLRIFRVPEGASLRVFDPVSWCVGYNDYPDLVHELVHSTHHQKPVQLSDVTVTKSAFMRSLRHYITSPSPVTFWDEGRAEYARVSYQGKPSRFSSHFASIVSSFSMFGIAAICQISGGISALTVSIPISLVGAGMLWAGLTYWAFYNSLITLTHELGNATNAFLITSLRAASWKAIFFPKSFYKWELVAAKRELSIEQKPE